MAGGKETPRQKLIGLMYLVLLALLALQVSGSIMEKFFYLEKSLEAAKNETLERNVSTVKQIESVAKERNTEKALEAMKRAQEVRKLSEDMTSYIFNLKKQLVEMTEGTDPETGAYIGEKDEDKTATFLVGPGDSKNGKGYELKKKLDEYVTKLKALVPSENKADFDKLLQPLAQNGSEDPILKRKEEQRNKDFAEANFAHVPMVAVMAVLEDKAAKVASYEAEVLSVINPEGATIKFDEVVADYKAKSEIVAAGTKYEAQIFLAGKNKSLKPQIEFGGRSLAVDENGFGKIEFTASGGAYKDGKAEKSWSAKVTIPGQPKPQEIVGKYFVSEPVIDVSSGAVSALYVGCGNPLKINVPALGALYDPSFQASNAVIEKGQDKINITVLPQSKGKVTIKVASAGTSIGEKVFETRDVPLPRIEIATGAQSGAINPLVGVSSKASSCIVRIVPDASFAAALPAESKYEIEDGFYFLGRGKSKIGGNRPLGKGLIALRDLNIVPGDQIFVSINKLVRINYKGSRLPVELPQSVAITSFKVGD